MNLPKQNRLNESARFQEIFKKGSKKVSPYFVIYILQNKLNISRIGIITSKKVGKANIRNRLRRSFKEFFYKHYDLSINKDFVIVVRSKAGEVDKKELFNNLASQLEITI